MKKLNSIISLLTIIIAFYSCQQPESALTFTDERDGNVYVYTEISNQTWMAQNLRYKPESGISWAYDDKESRGDTFGFLYDFERANNVCPEGWHLPTRAEWDTLIAYLGGAELAGASMKAPDEERWGASFKEGANSSGFSALPEGVRRYDGRYSYFNKYAYFWTSSESGKEGESWCFALDGPQKRIHKVSWNQDNALSVRCVKD